MALWTVEQESIDQRPTDLRIDLHRAKFHTLGHRRRIHSSRDGSTEALLMELLFPSGDVGHAQLVVACAVRKVTAESQLLASSIRRVMVCE